MTMYTELAGWWQPVSPTSDYADEAAFFKQLFQAENANTILELGSGGGNVAWFRLWRGRGKRPGPGISAVAAELSPGRRVVAYSGVHRGEVWLAGLAVEDGLRTVLAL